ncbi:hypothetical protein KFK09_006368 [Dendrobium nobile]|uniref:Uncharacterized protein n=1 Tax=Dendrobium nobile TaxID=94219 RepID=A0A8T3BTG6_DENNO|nr:hypothetical protein KFK09_006368 [Dendrobium nobile]
MNQHGIETVGLLGEDQSDVLIYAKEKENQQEILKMHGRLNHTVYTFSSAELG